jgi:hypothetical protein
MTTPRLMIIRTLAASMLAAGAEAFGIEISQAEN